MCFNHSKINGITSSEITQRKTNGVGFHPDVEFKKRNEQTKQNRNRLSDTEKNLEVARGEG